MNKHNFSENALESVEFSHLVQTYIKQTFTLTLFFSSLAYFAFIIYISFPILFPNVYILPLLFRIPFLPDNYYFWICNYIYQIVIIFFGAQTLICFDVMIFYLMNHCSWLMDTIKINFQMLNDMLGYDEKNNKETIIHQQIVKIVQTHQIALAYAFNLTRYMRSIIVFQTFIHMVGLGLLLNTLAASFSNSPTWLFLIYMNFSLSSYHSLGSGQLLHWNISGWFVPAILLLLQWKYYNREVWWTHHSNWKHSMVQNVC